MSDTPFWLSRQASTLPMNPAPPVMTITMSPPWYFNSLAEKKRALIDHGVGGQDEIDRIDFGRQLVDFVMKVRAGTSSAVPHIAYNLTAFHRLSLDDRGLLEMSVHGLEAA